MTNAEKQKRKRVRKTIAGQCLECKRQAAPNRSRCHAHLWAQAKHAVAKKRRQPLAAPQVPHE